MSHTRSTFPQSCNKSGASALLPISHYTHNSYRAAAAINPNQLHGSNFCCCYKSFCPAELYESSTNLKLVHAKTKQPCYAFAPIIGTYLGGCNLPGRGHLASICWLSEQVLNTSQPWKLSIVSLDNNCIPLVISYRADNRNHTVKRK